MMAGRPRIRWSPIGNQGFVCRQRNPFAGWWSDGRSIKDQMEPDRQPTVLCVGRGIHLQVDGVKGGQGITAQVGSADKAGCQDDDRGLRGSSCAGAKFGQSWHTPFFLRSLSHTLSFFDCPLALARPLLTSPTLSHPQQPTITLCIVHCSKGHIHTPPYCCRCS